MTLTSMRDLLKDGGVWCVAATVQLLDGATQHYRRAANGQIIVSVVTNLQAVPIEAFLLGGDFAGRGFWMIPAVGTEVMICFDNGDFEGDAFIVATIGRAPQNLDGEVTIISDSVVKIVADKVNICEANEVGLTAEGVVVGTGMDPFTGQTYNALGNSSGKVFAKK